LPNSPSTLLQLLLDLHVALQAPLWHIPHQLAPIIQQCFLASHGGPSLTETTATGCDILTVNACICHVIDDHVDVTHFADEHIGAPFDDLSHPQLHLFDSLSVDSVFAVHVARLEELAGGLDQVEDLAEGRLVVDVERQRGECLLEVGERDIGARVHRVAHF